MSGQNRSGIVVVGYDNLPGFLFLGVGVMLGWLIGSNKRSAPVDGPQTVKIGAGDILPNRSIFEASATGLGPILDLGDLANFYKEVSAAIDTTIGKIEAAGGGNPTSPLYPVYTYLVNLRLALNHYVESQANNRLEPVLAQLTQLGATLTTQAQALPAATNDVNQINAFLGTITSIINLIK